MLLTHGIPPWGWHQGELSFRRCPFPHKLILVTPMNAALNMEHCVHSSMAVFLSRATRLALAFSDISLSESSNKWPRALTSDGGECPSQSLLLVHSFLVWNNLLELVFGRVAQDAM